MARARDLPGLDCDGPLRVAAVQAVAVRSEELFEHSAGVLRLEEVEGVHDMRVATRRLRAVLEVFESCFPRRSHRRMLKLVKALADALGERRDRDVQLDLIEGFIEQAPEEERASLARLAEELAGERLRANEALAALVAEERLGELRAGLAELTRAASP